jgi:hypothetical protein
MAQILIGALSGWKHHERRERCLATWMADAAKVGVEAVFLLGCPALAAPELIAPHHLCLPCADDYPSLPQRTLWFCRWALGERRKVEGGRRKDEIPPSAFHLSPFFDWDYLFKCDDDTYISIPRLLAFCDMDLGGRDYVGAEWRPGVGYGSGGAGYFLSRKAAGLVAQRLEQATGAEDLLVGRLLRAAGVEFSIEPRLVPFGSMEHRPKRENDLITLHGVQAGAFLAAHAETGLHAAGGMPSRGRQEPGVTENA